MVYCGKPSKGCSSCRERKIRCDQKEPECGQCEKRQSKCPGYRNIVDLMFRDESNHVIKRATSSRTRSKKVKTSSTVQPSASQLPPPYTAACSPLDALILRENPRPSPQSRGSRTSTEGSPLSSAVFDVKHETIYRVSQLQSVPESTTSSSVERNGLDSTKPSVEESDDCQFPTHPPHAPSISLQERGTAFFFSRYVATDHGCYQNYDFIYDVWRPPSEKPYSRAKATDDWITASMTAVGLVGLSKLTGCRETSMRAQQSYGIALKLANAALRDPHEAVKDVTLLGVLILGTYEFISGNTPQTLHAWQEHLNGAAALANMRGTGQFSTKAGRRMFTMLSHSVLISCIQSGLPMPRAIVELRDQLRLVTDSKRPAWRVIDPLYRALQIRHDIRTRRITGVDEIVDSLVEVEKEFEVLVDGLPDSWRYKEVELDQADPAVMGRTCHVYPGLTQATSWNAVRTMRMLVQETILEQLIHSVDDPTTLPMRHQIQLVKATRLLRMIGDAVIGSVPQHFGIVSLRDVKRSNNQEGMLTIKAQTQPSRIVSTPLQQMLSHDSNKTTRTPSMKQYSSLSVRPNLFNPTQSELNSRRECDAERFLTLATASNTIIWPLYTLGLSSSCSHETRAYIVDRLLAIHQETGLEQARNVAGMMQGKVESLIWSSIPTARLPSLPHDALPTVV